MLREFIKLTLPLFPPGSAAGSQGGRGFRGRRGGPGPDGNAGIDVTIEILLLKSF